ncbi:MerR family transcriptional regulator [Novosphingobium sp.]|uniref:MerR family transcriptional regulator n=1 Tax=Novosphingobium sp. TaxID=1874826 RepID=UPI0038B898A2
MTKAHGTPALFALGEVAAATGLGADVLRAWERRYGFPVPLRDARGRRVYPRDQVERLELVRRLVDSGERPGQIMTLQMAELQARAARLPHVAGQHSVAIGYSADVEEALRFVIEDRLEALADLLHRHLARHGGRGFVIGIAAPLTAAVGEAWRDQRIPVFREHAFTHVLHRVLAMAARGLGKADGPRMLLTTVPGEAHGLGLAMVEAILVLEGCHCVPLGLETPPADIAAAALAHRVDVVALSFSSFFGARQAVRMLMDVRARLDPGIAIWAGGACSGLAQVRDPGIARFTDLAAITPALEALRLRD